jgi:hypothetical protein
MAFRPKNSGSRPTANPGQHDQLSDLYSKGRLPVSRKGHVATGPNVHSARPNPPVMRTRTQDPAVQSQRFPLGGGTSPGSGGRAPSAPAEPQQPRGFDPHMPGKKG